MDLKSVNLKNIFNFKELEKLFRNYALTTGLDVALYDTDGNEQFAVRKHSDFCSVLRENPVCRQKIVQSGKKSEELGAGYIFETPCGLIMCITPLVVSEQTLGYITSGPVILWENDEDFAEDFRENCRKMGVDPDAVPLDCRQIKQLDCERVTGMSEMLTAFVNYMAGEEVKYLDKRLELSRMSLERSAVLREMQIHELQPHYNKYPVELEKELIAYVQLGEKNQATLIINRFLNEIFSYASGDLEIIKAKLYEFTAFLSRSAVEAGASLSALANIIRKSSRLWSENLDFHDLCMDTVEILDDFIDVVYQSRKKKTYSEALARAIQYINVHYADDFNLETLAQNVFVSSYYLSHLFRQEMGITFRDYLGKIRVEHAKALLMEGLSVETTAERVGYLDSNHFIKLFKKHVGITPAKYKKTFS